jgi:hypothetical protein
MRQTSQIYRTARGIEIDMGKFTLQNELTPAVGNANVNARGDKLGPGGKIIQKREQLQINPLGASNQMSKKDESDIVSNNVVTKQTPIQATKKDVSNMDPEGNE